MKKVALRHIIFLCASIMGPAVLQTSAAQELRVSQCQSCTTIQGLRMHAQSYANHVFRNEAVSRFNVLVTSEAAPLSALYLAQLSFSGSVDPDNVIAKLTAITTNSVEADDLDATIFARKITPVRIPAEIAPSAVAGGTVWEDVNTLLRQTLPVSLLGGYRVTDMRTGAITAIPTNGLRVTVIFSDGSSAQLVITPSTALTSQAWFLVPGSERDADGEPYTGGVIGGLRGTSFNFSFGPISFGWGRAGGVCSVTATTCVPGGCSERRYRVACR